ncbi:HutD/Ves family protein [Spelaeicoccus albus]|uniref:HutD protein n=1 Tax=Spelaeicoccus albus TaxID=1280376 RepID=A0A7Z0D569_9MICO|nr:HutD family protein [Spelaeicoccus albus]NYI69104.1 hypothetical protein [Spelaeicoccus albus]
MIRTTVFPAAEHVRTPWRNGRGTTVELARQDGPDGFDWRLSIADISSEGEFSRFPGYRRVISTVEGAGMRLTVNDVPGDDLHRFVPFWFDGADHTECELLDGPIRDFNLIYRGDRVAAHLEWCRPESDAHLVSRAATTLLFNAGADLTVQLSDGQGESGTSLTLGHFDLMRLDAHDAPAATHRLSGAPDSDYCVVEIERIV